MLGNGSRTLSGYVLLNQSCDCLMMALVAAVLVLAASVPPPYSVVQRACSRTK